jgi:signal transduction histidine kinase
LRHDHLQRLDTAGLNTAAAERDGQLEVLTWDQAPNAAKATFLATMSHELRTPLNASVGYSALLHAEIHGSLQPQQKQHVSRIESAARHLIDLIEGILSFARIEAGRERVTVQDLRVAELAADVVALIDPLAKAKALDVVVQFGDPELRIVSDSAKIRQILLNLLSNAVKFTIEGHVGLEVRRDGADVLLIVSDTGIGVAPQNRERIFEPFRQAGDAQGSRAPGTGLGLSVSRQLARLLGGDVTLETARGPGSTFVARLPMRSAAASDGDGASAVVEAVGRGR